MIAFRKGREPKPQGTKKTEKFITRSGCAEIKMKSRFELLSRGYSLWSLSILGDAA